MHVILAFLADRDHTEDWQKVKLLVDAGADINLKNQYGESALSLAHKIGDRALIDFLTAKSQSMN
jgi:ankyrin repeat protein